ncbi:MAG: P-II family nitrogen regulator [Pirellulaceae bacterium]
MKQIIAIVKPFLAEKVLVELGKHGFTDITVREVHGYGRQKSYLSEYQQNEYSVVFLPKIEICIWADDGDVEEITSVVTQQARTGRMGDGKVFCIDVISERSWA